MFFSYDPENGIEFHETEEQAKKRAQAALDSEQDTAMDDGWGDQVDEICWGVVGQKVVETSREPAPDESEFAEIITYELR